MAAAAYAQLCSLKIFCSSLLAGMDPKQGPRLFGEPSTLVLASHTKFDVSSFMASYALQFHELAYGLMSAVDACHLNPR